MVRTQHHPVAWGAAIGLGWGSSCDAWMRYVSTDHEFSWTGTLFTVGAAAGVGALLGLARLRRRCGGIGWWRLVALSLGLLGAGGAVMWPAVVTGAAAMGLARPRWFRAGLAVTAAAVQIPIIQEVAIENSTFGRVDTVVAIVWYLPMLALEAWGCSVVFAPRAEGAPEPAGSRGRSWPHQWR